MLHLPAVTHLLIVLVVVAICADSAHLVTAADRSLLHVGCTPARPRRTGSGRHPSFPVVVRGAHFSPNHAGAMSLVTIDRGFRVPPWCRRPGARRLWRVPSSRVCSSWARPACMAWARCGVVVAGTTCGQVPGMITARRAVASAVGQTEESGEPEPRPEDGSPQG
jgi:hypothetical protein